MAHSDLNQPTRADIMARIVAFMRNASGDEDAQWEATRVAFPGITDNLLGEASLLGEALLLGDSWLLSEAALLGEAGLLSKAGLLGEAGARIDKQSEAIFFACYGVRDALKGWTS